MRSTAGGPADAKGDGEQLRVRRVGSGDVDGEHLQDVGAVQQPGGEVWEVHVIADKENVPLAERW
jgi:hypothetical protein